MSVASAAIDPDAVEFHGDQWNKFVRSSGLDVDGVTVRQYYLGDDVNEDITSDDLEKLFAELFTDAVAVGALTLPLPGIAESFRFRIRSGGPDYRQVDIMFRDRTLSWNSVLVGDSTNLCDEAWPETGLDSIQVQYSLKIMAEGLRSLLENTKIN